MVHKRSGFTLIELLVVIAIIALLLGIVIPSLGLAREKAKNLICSNNLHQYALAAEMYLNNNGESYPAAWNSLFLQSPSGWCQWHDKNTFLDKRPDLAGPLWPCLEMQKIHMCPTFARIGKQYGIVHPQHGNIPVEPQYSYSMNNLLGQDYGVMKRSQVTRPSMTFFFGEENMWVTDGLNGFVLNDNALCVMWNTTSSLNSPPPFTDSFGFFHNVRDIGVWYKKNWTALRGMDIGNTYAVFVDGHVQPVKPIDSYRLARPK